MANVNAQENMSRKDDRKYTAHISKMYGKLIR